MTMRTAIRILALAGALLILGVSCYWAPQNEQDGTITVEMGQITGQAQLSEGSDTARVYLLVEQGSSQGLYPLDGGEMYADVDFDETISIEGIAPGSGYRVLISFGSEQNGFFQVTEYAESEPITVESGADAEVTVQVQDSPFVYPSDGADELLNGQDLNGVVFTGGAAFVADASSVFRVQPNLQGAVAEDLGGEPEINTLSRGDDHPVLVNTQEGIFYRDGAGNWAQTNYQEPVTLSAQFADDVIFQSTEKLGVAANIDDPVEDWVEVPVGEVTAGSPIRDYAIDFSLGTGGGEAGVALVSVFGAFRAETGVFDTLADDSDWDDIQDAIDSTEEDLGFFDNDVAGQILSVGYGTSGTESTLYVGTDQGVFEETSPGTFELIPETAGNLISRVAAGGSDVRAFVGPYYLYVTDGETTVSYPFVAGFPGNPTDFTWGTVNGTPALYIAGDEGLVGAPARDNGEPSDPDYFKGLLPPGN